MTERERTIAFASLGGQSHGVSAREFGISINTLRNAVSRIYRKLGVTNKLELAQRAGFVLPMNVVAG